MDNVPIGQLIATISANLVTAEGIVNHWYKCTSGVDTIGIGFTKDAFVDLDDDDYRLMLGIIIRRRLIQVARQFPWFEEMPSNIQGVVFEMCYQMGIEGFSQFKTTIKHLRKRRWLDASKTMLQSKWAREQTPERAKRLSDIVANEGKPKIIRTGGKIIDVNGRIISSNKN